MLCGDPNNPNGPGLSANGNPCKQPCVPGQNRCYVHFKNNAIAKIKAEQTMALLRMPAIEVLYNSMQAANELLEQFVEVTCVTCGYPSGDNDEKEAHIRAIRTAAQTCASILDRCGMAPRTVFEVQQTDGDLDLSLCTDSEMERMMAALAEYESVKQEMRNRLNGIANGPTPTAIHPNPTSGAQVTH